MELCYWDVWFWSDGIGWFWVDSLFWGDGEFWGGSGEASESGTFKLLHLYLLPWGPLSCGFGVPLRRCNEASL